MPNERRSRRGRGEELLQRLGFRVAPIPVDKVAKALGAEVRYSPLDEELSGMIFVKDGTPIIGVNSLHHPHRQRFTIGHETAHLVLHKNLIMNTVHVDKKYPMLMRGVTASMGTDAIEIEANEFAAELLIPKFLLDESPVDVLSLDIEDDKPLELLSKKFRVSKQMVIYRIRNLPQKTE